MTEVTAVHLIPPRGGRVRCFMRRHHNEYPIEGMTHIVTPWLDANALAAAWISTNRVADKLMKHTGTVIDVHIEPAEVEPIGAEE